MHPRTIQTVLLALAAACCLAADADSSFKSLTAKQAKANFDRSLSAAKAAHDRAVAGAMAKYLLALKAAKLEATKRGDLAEAVAIEKEQKQIEVGVTATDPIVGTAFKNADNSVGRFMADGRWVSSNGRTARWARLGDRLLCLSYPDAPKLVVLFELQPDGSAKWWNSGLRGQPNVAKRVK